MGRRLVAGVATLLCVAGCTGVPARSGVHVVRRVSAEGPDLPEARGFRRVPESPREKAPPDEIVRGFLAAHGDTRNDRAIARKYLGPQVTWNDDARATVVAATPRTGRATVDARGDDATVPVTLDQVGTISPKGEFRAALAPARTVVTFRLHRYAAGWRLAEARPGVVLGRDEVANAYDRVTLWFPNQARRLVPDTVFLPTSAQPVTSAVRALLGGPGAWLAPAVRSAIPAGTELLDPPSVVDRVATVNFSREVGRAPQETLGAVVAQVVWTLTERPLEVDAVRVLVEGKPLAVAGHSGGREQRRTDWLDYAPVPPTADARLYLLRNGAAYALGPGGLTRLVRTQPLLSIAVNRSGTTMAAVTRGSGGRRSLVLVDLAGGAIRTALTAERITTPTWEPGGDTVWVAHSSGEAAPSLVSVSARSGAPAAVVAPVPGPVTALRLSPDGSRAGLIAGVGAAARLWVARVERPASGGRVLADARPVAPSVAGVTALAFDGAGQISFAAFSRGRPALYRVDVDGYGLDPQRGDPLPRAAVTALGVSASVPPERVASVGGRVWRRTPGGDWTALPGSGGAATYAG